MIATFLFCDLMAYRKSVQTFRIKFTKVKPFSENCILWANSLLQNSSNKLVQNNRDKNLILNNKLVLLYKATTIETFKLIQQIKTLYFSFWLLLTQHFWRLYPLLTSYTSEWLRAKEKICNFSLKNCFPQLFFL